MFGGKAKLKAELARVKDQLLSVQTQLDYRNQEWNKLVNRINALGGDEFLRHAKLPHQLPKPWRQQEQQFSRDEIKVLISLCHPDKHKGKSSAVDMTQKLLKIRNK